MLRRPSLQTTIWPRPAPQAVAEHKGVRLVHLHDLGFGQWREFCALYRDPLLAELNRATPLTSPTLLMAPYLMKGQGQRRITLAVMLPSGKVIGAIELYDFEPSISSAERATLGIMLCPHHWGKGLGAKALCALLCLGFGHGPTVEASKSELHLGQIDLDTLPTNERAIALFRKLGFVEGGKSGELLHMRLKRQEWLQRVTDGQLP